MLARIPAITQMISRNLAFISLLLTLGCNSTLEQDGLIRPNWEVDDHRTFVENGSMLVVVGTDTITDANYEKRTKITVIDRTDHFYIVEIQLLPEGGLTLATSIDSLQEMLNSYSDVADQILTITQQFQPYQLKIDKEGQVIEIYEFDKYFVDLMLTIDQISDTIEIAEEDQIIIESIFKKNNQPLKEQIAAGIINEISEYFDVFDVKDIIKGIREERIDVPDPKTGRIFPAKIVYKSKSKTESIHEIHAILKFEEPIEALIESDSIKSNNSKKFNLSDMKSLTKYYFNTKTTWVDKVISTTGYQTSDFIMKINSEVITIK